MHRMRLRQHLLDGGRALGCWIYLDSTFSTEAVAAAGFDFLIFDHEHGPGDPRLLAHQLQAMSGSTTAAMVRVPAHDPAWIKRVLDVGAQAVMVPSVDTAEQARAVAAACRYPPRGTRGMAPGIIRASGYGADAADYVARVDDDTLVVCQVETVAAVECIDELLAVDAVDLFFLGPNDLSASLGAYGRYDDPAFADLMRRAESAILGAGRLLGGLPYGTCTWEHLFDRGYHLTTGGADLSLLRQACAAVVDRYRAGRRES